MSYKLRRFIAWWQIVSGILGYLALAISALNWPTGSRRILMEVTGPLNILLGVAYFSLCIFFGLRLLRNYHDGFLISAVCQAVQAINFAFLNGPHVMIQAGPQIAVTLAENSFNLSLGFNSTFFLGTRVQGPAWEVTINLLALYWAILLFRAMPSRDVGIVEAAV
jgi:hypothetical protein